MLNVYRNHPPSCFTAMRWGMFDEKNRRFSQYSFYIREKLSTSFYMAFRLASNFG